MKNEKTTMKYIDPELQVIHLTEVDIITSSNDPFKDEEGEFIPA